MSCHSSTNYRQLCGSALKISLTVETCVVWPRTGTKHVSLPVLPKGLLEVYAANSYYVADPHYFAQVSEFARTWMAGRIAHTRAQFGASSSPMREYVLDELKKLEDKIPDLKYPFE